MNHPLAIRSVTGMAVPIIGNDIDTDRIVPASFLKEITFDNMGNYLFYNARYNNGQKNRSHPLNQPRFAKATVMLVQKNFGCGSSREHAPQAIKRAGFNMIVGESFAEIFSGNCKALGIVTISLEKTALGVLFDHVSQFPESVFSFDLLTSNLTVSGMDEPFRVDMKDAHKKSFLNGTWDELSLLKLNNSKIDELASQLPYFNW